MAPLGLHDIHPFLSLLSEQIAENCYITWHSSIFILLSQALTLSVLDATETCFSLCSYICFRLCTKLLIFKSVCCRLAILCHCFACKVYCWQEKMFQCNHTGCKKKMFQCNHTGCRRKMCLGVSWSPVPGLFILIAGERGSENQILDIVNWYVQCSCTCSLSYLSSTYPSLHLVVTMKPGGLRA